LRQQSSWYNPVAFFSCLEKYFIKWTQHDRREARTANIGFAAMLADEYFLIFISLSAHIQLTEFCQLLLLSSSSVFKSAWLRAGRYKIQAQRQALHVGRNYIKQAKMKVSVSLFILICFIQSTCISQMPEYNIDSMVSIRTLDTINGNVKTYYSPGNKERAMKAKRILESAVAYYVSKYKRPFEVKLLMLDSAQWLHNILPWGFNFFNNGWAIVNTGLSMELIFESSGIKERLPAFELYLKQYKLSPQEYNFSNDMVTVVHEMGHYYIMKIRGITTSGMWFNEVGTNYLTYNYFMKNNPTHCNNAYHFYHFMLQNNSPKYKELLTWDTMNISMPSDNFIWFDANTQLLIKKIYKAKGEKFMDAFFKAFEGKKPEELDLEVTAKKLDGLSGGIVAKWRSDLKRE